MEDSERFVPLMTKVRPYVHRALKRIERMKGLSTYAFQQLVCDTIVRYADSQHNLSPEMEAVMNMFDHLEGVKDTFTLADPTAEWTPGEAIYVIFDGNNKKHGARAVHIASPFFDDKWTEDANIQHIIERVFELIVPELYRRMRVAIGETGCNSLLEYLQKLVDMHANDSDIAEIRKTFEDNDRSDYGIKPKEDGPYKRRINKHIEDEFKFNEDE